MQSTEPKVATCQKCGKIVFTAQVSGINTLVDPSPVPAAALIAFLTQGHSLYEGIFHGKQLHRLKVSGSLDGDRYVSHGCTNTGTVRASVVELADAGPRSAPATPGGSLDGLHHPTAPVSGSQGHTAKITKADCSEASPSHAINATPRPSKPTRCRICNDIIYGHEQGIVAIQHGERMVWAEHVEH